MGRLVIDGLQSSAPTTSSAELTRQIDIRKERVIMKNSTKALLASAATGASTYLVAWIAYYLSHIQSWMATPTGIGVVPLLLITIGLLVVACNEGEHHR